MPNSQRYHLKNKEIRVLPPEIHAELESQSQDMQRCIRRKSSFKCYSFILIFKYVQSWNEERVNHGTRIGQSWNEDRVNHGTRIGSTMERGQGQSWNEERVNHGTRIGSIMERGKGVGGTNLLDHFQSLTFVDWSEVDNFQWQFL